VDDFDRFDYILAMDHDNLANLKTMCPASFSGRLGLMLDYTVAASFAETAEVPDPYYGGEDGFSLVLALVEDACDGLLDHIRMRL
jgi:protein-tyrosine phosphatase